METTLNIHHCIMEKITGAAMAKKITRSEMIVLLLNKVLENTHEPFFLGKMIKYQERKRQDEWHRFHIVLRPDEYEFFLDLRKLLKMSVSLILAYAVEKYLKHIMKRNTTDNYLHRNYLMIKELVDGIKCWKFYWGYPPGIEKHLT